jgi:hypothetical protein
LDQSAAWGHKIFLLLLAVGASSLHLLSSHGQDVTLGFTHFPGVPSSFISCSGFMGYGNRATKRWVLFVFFFFHVMSFFANIYDFL